MNGRKHIPTSTTTELSVQPGWRQSLSLGGCGVMMAGSLLVRSFFDDDSSLGGAFDTLGRVLEVSVVVLFVLCLILVPVALVVSRRRGARLEGATLTVAGPFGTRRADLAVARVQVKNHTLIADNGSPGTVRLGLHVLGRGVLPPEQLIALADALRPAAGQPPETHRQHWQVAAKLQELATDPSNVGGRRTGGRLHLALLLVGAASLALALVTS